ncbi:hypothetical protein B0T24DRAFT_697411 [Lasiosphaeria ovina]|uniref:F-box domain-containing protein n=1 Tax=Lasiosphaeria ovina TaxID=92902 RepID=A0AAE0NFR9_9PEZI|nr:hypothetical protein B0T24DRAFT_697411 [Lasiosphaeria ovina]
MYTVKALIKSNAPCERLRRLFRQDPEQPIPAWPIAADADCNLYLGSCLFRRPRDILFEILDHLPPESLLCLSLTCKVLSNLFGEAAARRVRTSPESKKALLLLPEGEVADRCLFCHDCIALHRINIRPRQRWRGRGRAHPDGIRMAGCSFSTLYWHGFNFGSPLRFNFHHARAATNKHHYGADAGLPVDVFRFDNAWSAKVVDDGQLLLRSVSTLAECSLGRGRRFRRALDEVPVWLCHHRYSDAGWRWTSEWRRVKGLPLDAEEPKNGGGSPDDEPLRPGSFGDSCHLCLTDIRTVVEWKNGKAGIRQPCWVRRSGGR